VTGAEGRKKKRWNNKRMKLGPYLILVIEDVELDVREEVVLVSVHSADKAVNRQVICGRITPLMRQRLWQQEQKSLEMDEPQSNSK
jgi:hypothetical protein